MSKIFLSNVTLTLTQDGDSDEAPGALQTLIVQVNTLGAGPFLIIDTQRWSFDQPAELTDLLTTISQQVFPLFEAIADDR